jgi:2-dehydropantoate 2-reductase
MRHLDVLADRFGAQRVLGGLAMISATIDANGSIAHLNDLHTLAFGELDGSRSQRIETVASALVGAGFDARLADEIRQEMWEKWVFIATGAAITCLMRAAIADIVAAGASDLVTRIMRECADIADAQGFPPRQASLERVRTAFTAAGSPLKASMLRDIERGMPVEGEHILGDLLRRTAKPDDHSVLRIAYLNVKAYEAGRMRGGTATP